MRILKIVLIFLLISVFLSVICFLILTQKINSLDIKSTGKIASILILGKGGEGHTAPDLTDTIIVSAINLESNKISLLSLPRDIWVDSTRAKLNSSYYWGKQKAGNGFDLAGDTIREVTNLEINYVVVVNFSLFKDVVDTLGGIDVNIENTFTDEKYPIAGLENDLCNGDKEFGCRFEKLEFKNGIQHMNGDTALKFVRSRNAAGDEGTDIAREKRQQKVISAVKEKLLSFDFLFNFQKVKSLYKIVFSHIESNISRNDLFAIGREFYKSRNNINYLSIPETILTVSQGKKRYDRQYVFVPASGTWKNLQEWITQNI
jgi:LCP family protein required for cell wall assembly